MDFIIIGKSERSRASAPHVVYCGQDLQHGLEAVSKATGLTYFYRLNPEPMLLVFPPTKPAEPATQPVDVSDGPGADQSEERTETQKPAKKFKAK